MLVDYIIPYEDLGTHFGLICESMGLKSPLQERNVSRIKDTEDELSDSLKSEICEFFAQDYELLGQIEKLNEEGLQHLKKTQALL